MGSVFLSSMLLDRKGKAEDFSPENIANWNPEQGILWLHLDGKLDWMEEVCELCGLDEFVQDALSSPDPRPRSYIHNGGLLIILRGVNMNPEGNPEDMVAIRLWIEKDRIITVRRRKVMAVDDIRNALRAGKGPENSADFLIHLADCLTGRMPLILDRLESLVDELEENDGRVSESGLEISDLRRKTIQVRRHLAPQRDVMIRLHAEKLDWLSEYDRMQLREIMELLQRYVEDLDICKERADVIQDEIKNRHAEQTNRILYLFSLITVIFLPLSFLTGLLGINVGGMPGADKPEAFWIVCAILFLIFGMQIFFFRTRKWL